MRRKPGMTSHDQTIEKKINRAGSIGALERLAGVGASDAERFDFWQPFATLPASESLDAGVAELKRRIRAREARPPARPAKTRKGAVERGRFVRAVNIRDGDTPEYFDLTLDRAKVARALRGEALLTRLSRKHAVTAEEILLAFQPGAHRDPSSGDVTINAGWDPAFDEGRIEELVWSLVRPEVEAFFAQQPGSGT